MQADMDDYLSKPLNPNNLQVCIQHLCKSLNLDGSCGCSGKAEMFRWRERHTFESLNMLIYWISASSLYTASLPKFQRLFGKGGGIRQCESVRR